MNRIFLTIFFVMTLLGVEAAPVVMVPMTTNGVVLVPGFAVTNNLLTTTNGALFQTGSDNLTNWAALGTNTLGLFAHNLNGSITNPYIVGGMNMDSNQPAPTYLEGKVFYDTTQHTLAYYNDNSNMMVNVAQENVTRVRNRSGVTIPDGSTVYLTGAQGQVSTVALALGNDPVAGRVYGVSTVDMLDGDFGYVTISGLVNGLNTSAYWDGSDIYASTNVAGGFQTNSYPGATLIGKVAYAHNNQGRILVNIVQNAVLSAQQTNWPAAAITNAPWQYGHTNLTNWASIPTNVLSSLGQTNFPYTAITNSPWLSDNWVGRVISGEATTVTLGTGSKLELTDGTPFIFDSVLTGAFHGTFTGSLTGNADSATTANYATTPLTTGAAPTRYAGIDDDSLFTWTRDGSLWTNLQASAITGNLTNNTSGNSAYATNAGTAAYVSGNLTNRVSFSTNAALASFVSGKLTNSISGTADEALFANSAGTATSATSANTANFATSATSATYANFATNAMNFAVSNALTLGITYPTVVTSGSAGLAIDQPLTVGGTTPGVTLGSGGPSITASGATLNLRTNVVVGSNSVTIAAGSANTLVGTNGLVGIGVASPTSRLHVGGGIAGSALIITNGITAASADLTGTLTANAITVAGGSSSTLNPKVDIAFNNANNSGLIITDVGTPGAAGGGSLFLTSSNYPTTDARIGGFAFRNGRTNTSTALITAIASSTHNSTNGETALVFATTAQGGYIRNNRMFLGGNGTLTVSNTLTTSNLIVGTTYPTLLTSDSTGLVTDQPLTVGGVTPSITLGVTRIQATGGSATASPLISATNWTGTVQPMLSVSGSNNPAYPVLTVINSRLGIRTNNPTSTLDVSGSIAAATDIYAGNNVVAVNSMTMPIASIGQAYLRSVTPSGAGSVQSFSIGPYQDGLTNLFFGYSLPNAASRSTNINFQFIQGYPPTFLLRNGTNGPAGMVVGGDMVVTNTLTASNIVSQTAVTATNFMLSVPRWKDSPIVFTWGTGATAPARTAFVPANGISALGFVNNDVADFQTQFGHDIAPSNSTLYTEFHLHAMPMDATAWTPTTCRKTFTVKYFGAALNVSNAVTILTNVTPVTNVFTDVLLEKNAQVLFEGNHWSFTNFYPGISGKVWGTVTVTDAGNSNYTGAVTLDMDFHYPVDRMGSSADTAP